MDKKKNKKNIEKEIKQLEKEKSDKLKKLNDFKKEYNVDKLLEDLDIYFDQEVDFNFDKIKAEIQAQNKLKDLIAKACQKQTHPVVEFIQETLKDL